MAFDATYLSAVLSEMREKAADARVGAIAVDPEVFPYGTRFYILTKDGEYIYGVATAEDCGDKRFIYDTRLDLFFNTKRECVQFGARMCDVYILG